MICCWLWTNIQLVRKLDCYRMKIRCYIGYIYCIVSDLAILTSMYGQNAKMAVFDLLVSSMNWWNDIILALDDTTQTGCMFILLLLIMHVLLSWLWTKLSINQLVLRIYCLLLIHFMMFCLHLSAFAKLMNNNDMTLFLDEHNIRGCVRCFDFIRVFNAMWCMSSFCCCKTYNTKIFWCLVYLLRLRLFYWWNNDDVTCFVATCLDKQKVSLYCCMWLCLTNEALDCVV